MFRLYHFLNAKIQATELKLSTKLEARLAEPYQAKLFYFNLVSLNLLLIFWQIASDLLKFVIILALDPGDSFNLLFRQRELRSCPYSYHQYKTIRQKLRLFSAAGLAALVIATSVTSLILNLTFGGKKPTFAATFGWLQTSFAGGATTTNAVHPGQQTGWTHYLSKDAGVTITASGTATLALTVASTTQTTDADFAAGQLASTTVSGTGDSAGVTLAKLETAGSWQAMANAPITPGKNTAVYGKDGNLYAFGALFTDSFYKYDIASGAWTKLASAPGYVGFGSAFAYGEDGNIYVLQGANSSWVASAAFWKYNIASNSWSALANLPTAIGNTGSDLVSDKNGNIFAVRGGVNNFLKYNIASNSWTQMAGTPVSASSAEFVYGDDGYIYALLALYMNSNFYRYSIASNTWAQLPNALSQDPTGLVYDGNGNIYAANRSYPSNSFSRYNISAGSWTNIASSPGNWGLGDMAYDNNGNIYAFQGGNNVFWKYSLYDNYASSGTFESATVDLGVKGTLTSIVPSITVPRGASAQLSLATADAPTGPWDYFPSDEPLIPANADAKVIRQDCSGYSNCYTSLAAWAAAKGGINYGACASGDLVCADKIAVARIEGSWSSPEVSVPNFSGWVTGQYNYIRIYTAPEARHTGKWETNKYVLQANNTIYPPNYTKISGIQLDTTGSVGFFNPNYGEISQCILKNSGPSHIDLISTNSGGTQMYIWNNIFIGGSFYYAGSFAPVLSYNNTFYGGGLNQFSGGKILAINNIVQGVADGYKGSSFYAGSNYNISDVAGDAPGANSKNGVTVEFVDAANGDFRLAASDTVARDAGADLSNDANWKVFNDIAGNRRVGSWDIGAHEYGAVSLFQSMGSKRYVRYRVELSGGGSGWQYMASLPNPVYGGGAITYGSNGNIYAFRGNSSVSFLKYSIASNSWSSLADAPASVYSGGSLAHDNRGNIYAFRGNSDTAFWRYSIASNAWSVLTGAPLMISSAGALASANDGNIYALGNAANFWKYSVASNTWSSLANAPASVGVGAALAGDSKGNLYAFRGGYNTFWKYSIANNTWSSLASAPTAVSGGSLINDNGGGFYGFQGNGYTDFWKYSVSGNSWTARASAPEGLGGGGASAYDNVGNVYTLKGANTATFWKYYPRVSVAPTVAGIVFVYQSYSASSSLTSSAYDSTDAGNILAQLRWSEVLASSTDVTFQLRTSPDGSTWTGWLGPDGTSGTSFTDPAGGEAVPAALMDGADDRYFQYRATLSSDGVSAPELNSTDLTYVVNAPPSISLANVPEQAADGTITLDYEVADSDTATGRTPGSVYVRLEYCTANCTATGTETWAAASVGALAGQFAATAVSGASSTAYRLVWTPRLDFAGQYFFNDFKVRLSADDAEAANNLARVESSLFALDTKPPAFGPVPLAVDASVEPAQVSLSVTDDSPNLVMRLGTAPDLSSAATSSYLATTTLDLSARPAGVYAEFTDRVGNLSTTSVTLPETPTAMMIQDNTNLFSDPHEYRLFLAWKVPAAPSAGFSHYRIERSDDNANWSTIASTSNRLVNYYGDSTVTVDQLYYYRVSMVDQDGNVSYASGSVSGKANGTQDAGEGGGGVGAAGVPPVITGVTATSTYSTTVTIEWETDALSDSLVYYQEAPGGDFSSAPTLGAATLRSNAASYGKHQVTLTDLTPSTTYYYIVRSTAVNDATASSSPGGDGYSFTTLSGPIIANDVQASGITNSQATISWSTDLSSASAVRYATSSDLVNPVTVAIPDLVLSHVVSLSGLAPGTTYYFAVESDTARRNNADGQPGYFSFQTTEDAEPPVISNVRCGHTADTTLSVLWTTNEPATGQASYGTVSSGYATTTQENTNLNLDHSFDLENLLASTTYYFIVNSRDENGLAATSTEYSCSTAGPLKTEEEVRNLVEAARQEGRSQVPASSPSGGGGILVIDKTDKTAPVISGLAVSEIKSDSAQVSWATNEPAVGILRYGTGQDLKDSAGADSFVTANRLGLANLAANSTYYYKLTAVDQSGNAATSAVSSFTTPTLEQELKAEGKTEAEIKELEKQAEQKEEDKGKIILEAAKRAMELVSKVASQVSLGTLESTLLGQYDAIEELARAIPAPILGGEPSVITTATTAEIRWTTDKEANSLVALAPDKIYAINASKPEPYIRFDGKAKDRVKNHTVLVADLKPDTTYHFQLRSEADLGPAAKSRDFTFTTRSETLEIVTHAVQNLSATKATIKWLTSQETDTQFSYTPYRNGKLSIEERQVKNNPALTTQHEASVDDFEGGVIYQLELAGVDVKKNRVSKVIDAFSTSKDDLPPEIVSIQTESALSQGKETKVQTIISWQTPEPTVGYVSYAKGVVASAEAFLDKTPVETSYGKKHVAVITKFEPGAVYSFRVSAADSSGNETVSKTYTVLAPRQKESVFQLILKNFEDIFGWMGKVGQ